MACSSTNMQMTVKTPVLWLRHKNQIDKINIRTVPVLSSSVGIVNTARNLGKISDSCLTMSEQVSALYWAAYFQLRQLRPVARSLLEEAAKVFIACRLEYCSALFLASKTQVRGDVITSHRFSVFTGFQ